MSQITQMIAGVFQPYEYESITVTDTAIGLTATKYKPANNEDTNANRPAMRVLITVETAQCRYRCDGTAPEAAEGHILNANDSLILVGPDAISRFKAIRTGATSSVLKVTYER